MQIGHLAFTTILLNHAAFEVARVGSMTSRPGAPNEPQMERILRQMLPQASIADIDVEPTFLDREVAERGQRADPMNYDIVVTLRYHMPLIFPIVNILFQDPEHPGTRELRATVRMPIERPLVDIVGF